MQNWIAYAEDGIDNGKGCEFVIVWNTIIFPRSGLSYNARRSLFFDFDYKQE